MEFRPSNSIISIVKLWYQMCLLLPKISYHSLRKLTGYSSGYEKQGLFIYFFPTIQIYNEKIFCFRAMHQQNGTEESASKRVLRQWKLNTKFNNNWKREWQRISPASHLKKAGWSWSPSARSGTCLDHFSVLIVGGQPWDVLTRLRMKRDTNLRA